MDAGSNNGSAMSAWVFDSARTAGEGAVVEDDPNSYVVVFRSIGREEYNTVDVRHILFLVDSSSLDKDSETYDADLQALKDGAKAKAEDALAQWQPTAGGCLRRAGQRAQRGRRLQHQGRPVHQDHQGPDGRRVQRLVLRSRP